MVVAIGIAAIFAGDRDVVRDEQWRRRVRKMNFVEGDFGGFNGEANIVPRGEEIGANADDLESILVDPGNALDEKGFRAPFPTDKISRSSAVGELGESNHIGVAGVEKLVA
jgi:hypothetical protein